MDGIIQKVFERKKIQLQKLLADCHEGDIETAKYCEWSLEDIKELQRELIEKTSIAIEQYGCKAILTLSELKKYLIGDGQ